MENFIRTKYSSKRWVLSPSPPTDPSILDNDNETDADTIVPQQDNIPLAIVKQSLTTHHPQKHPHSLPVTREPSSSSLTSQSVPPRRTTPDILPLRTESASPSRSRQDRVSNQSLLGLEFDSPVRTQSAPQFPPTTGTIAGGATVPVSRNELKNSILKLYAPKTVQSVPATPAPVSTPSVGGGGIGAGSAFGELTSAFGGLDANLGGGGVKTSRTTDSMSGFSMMSSALPVASATPTPTTTANTTGKLTFGQTKPVTVPAAKPAAPTTFSIPITTAKSTSPPVAPKSAPPTAKPSTSMNTTSILDNITPMPTSNYAPTFNLSNKSPAPIPTTTTTSSTTTHKPITLLSSMTPTTTNRTPSPIPSQQQQKPLPTSSFTSNPWDTTSSTTGGNTFNLLSDPWATTSAPATTTNPPPAQTVSDPFAFGSTSSTSISRNTPPPNSTSFSGTVKPASDDTWGSFGTVPVKRTPVGEDSWSGYSTPKADTWGGSLTKKTAVVEDSWGSFGVGGGVNGGAVGGVSESKENKRISDSDFGLFETADVWK